ncbi:MAG: hypothetical protein WAU49_04500 [Steroidobacteraceae bacterium]
MANTLIHENRRLQFPLDTLVDALIELENKQGHWPPKATVVGASIDNSGDGNGGVILSIHRPEGGDVTERRYSLPMIAAAIVNYCLTVRVPIPRNSTKSIQVLADGVALVLENTVMVQTRHEELSTLPAGSVHTVPSAPPAANSAPEDAVPPNEGGAPPTGATPSNEAAAPNGTAPPDPAAPSNEGSPPDEAARASGDPAG